MIIRLTEEEYKLLKTAMETGQPVDVREEDGKLVGTFIDSITPVEEQA